MAKKYLKNESGIVRAITSDNLQLEKPLLNENYDIEVHNRNMDKIDSAIQEVKGKIDGLELVAGKVAMADGSTVEATVTTNKSNISTLQSEVSANKTSILNNTILANQALSKANEAFQAGSNVKKSLVDKLTSEGLDVSTNNTFDELINSITLGKKWASGVSKSDTSTSEFYTRNASYGSLLKKNLYACTVENLSFKPSIVVGYEPNCTRSYNPHSIFVRDATNSYGDMMISCNFEVLYDYGVTEYFESGFKLPCKYSGMTLEWYAFE